MGSTSKRCLRFCAALLAAWLGLRLVLPLMYPFLLGTLLALGAERAADFLERRLRLPRFLAAGLAVGALVAGLGGLLKKSPQYHCSCDRYPWTSRLPNVRIWLYGANYRRI